MQHCIRIRNHNKVDSEALKALKSEGKSIRCENFHFNNIQKSEDIQLKNKIIQVSSAAAVINGHKPKSLDG